MLSLLKQKRIFGDAFWTLLGQLLSAAALLIGTRVISEMVSPDIYGQVALFNGFVALGVAVFAYPFICAGMRLQPECLNDRERASLQLAVFGLTARASLVGIGLLGVAGVAYAYMAQGDPWLFCLTGILLIVTVRRELGIQLSIGQRKHRSASLWQTTDSVLRPLLAIGLLWSVGNNTAWILAGYCLASILSNTVWSMIQDRQSDTKSNYWPMTVRNMRRDVLRYAVPLIPLELVFWINGLGDRYVIGYLLTATEVGLYAATYTIVNEAFNRSAMVLLRIFQPLYFHSYSQKRAKDALGILWAWIACVLMLGVVGIWLVELSKDHLASWILAKSYHAAAPLMPAIAMGCALHALGTVLAQPLLARKLTKVMLKGRVFGAVTAAVSLPLMVYSYGLPGAAMANPIYFGCEALVLALLAKPWQCHRASAPDVFERGLQAMDQDSHGFSVGANDVMTPEPLPVNR